MRVLRLAAFAVAGCLGLAAPGGAGEIRALLVGVSAYDDGVGIASLRGPANDVRLWQSTLAERGVSDIRIVADGVAGGTVPSRAAILSAFSDLAVASEAGDLVIITMSGHGTRQPDASGDETDGLDEVFLPADTGRAEAGMRAIPNAILDDEIGAAVDAIRATGADVWLVMDSCHSGSALRAVAPATAARYVDPAVLGIPDTAGDVEDGGGGEVPMAGDLPGQVMAFYAARASEVAREVNMVPDGTSDGDWYGLFTSRLAARVAGGEGLSYRQLFQAVLSDMNAAGVPGGARLQTPSWDGTMADAVVLGGQATSGVRQFAVNGDTISAGLVHGMGEGTLFALFADAADPPEAVLAHAQMGDVHAVQGRLRRVEPGCTPKSDAPCAGAGPLPKDARFARLVARPVDLALRLAPPRDLATGAPVVAGTEAADAFSAAVAEVNGAGDVHVVVDARDYAVDTVWADGALWFGRRVSAGDMPVGLEWRPDSGEDLTILLTRIARAERLAAMLSSVGGGGSLLNPSPVRVDPWLVPSDPADLDPAGVPADPFRECRRAVERVAGRTPAPLPARSDLKQCDTLRFEVLGELPGERDINRIHIDARFCVHADYAHVEDTARPVPLGKPMVICSDCPDGKASGDERMFVIVTESPENAERLNLESLVETCGEDADATRGAEAARMSGFLEALARRPDMRGGIGGRKVENVWVSTWEWQVLPKEQITQGGR